MNAFLVRFFRGGGIMQLPLIQNGVEKFFRVSAEGFSFVSWRQILVGVPERFVSVQSGEADETSPELSVTVKTVVGGIFSRSGDDGRYFRDVKAFLIETADQISLEITTAVAIYRFPKEKSDF